MSFSVQLYQRDFGQILTPIHLHMQPVRMSWAALGGPKEAEIEVTGAEAAIWELVERLRCPVEIFGADGRAAWWGYVEKISVQVGAISVDVSLEKTVNRICVTYAEVNTAGVVGERKSTTWYEDADSTATYGVKEGRLSKSQATSEEAAQYAMVMLGRLRYPLTAHRMQGGAGRRQVSGRLTCAGWWGSLGWRYYENTAGKESYEEIGSGLQAVGDAASRGRLAQSFMVAAGTAWEARSVKLRMKREGNPADSLTVNVCADSAGSPGAGLASASMAGSEVSENLNWHELLLNSRVTVLPGTVYWLVVTRSGGADAGNYFKIDANEALGYTNGVMRIWNGSTWTARSPDADMLFQVGGVEQTSAQLSRVLTIGGQFFSRVDVDAASGVYASPYRDGDQSALAVAEELLEAGTNAGQRLLAAVTRARGVEVFAEPSSGTREYLLHANGEVRDWLNRPMEKWTIPAGVWMRLANVLPASADVGRIADPSRVFVEEVEYNVSTDSVNLRERDAASLLELR